MRKYITYALLSILFATMACSEPVTEQMVVGKYVANHGIATDTIEVRADGTYTHYYKEADGEEYINENHWELEVVNGRPAVVFSDFESRWRKSRHAESPGFYPAFVERPFFGSIRLSISYDLGYYYIKEDSQEK